MSTAEEEFPLILGRSSPGRGETLEQALEDAYEKGKDRGRCFRVVEIQFCGTNPISDFKVWVTPI
jgi:hypothetical protein